MYSGGQDPNQGYYAPPPTGFPGQPGYPPQGGFPPQGGYPPQGGFPPQGGAGYPPQGPPVGFAPPPGGAPFGYHPPPAEPYLQPPPSAMYGGTAAYDPEGVKNFDFSEKSIRNGFIRKVYSILSLQLLLSVGFMSLMLYHPPTQKFVANNPFLFWVALIAMIVTLIALACCGEVRRKAPMNFIFLGIFTVAEAFLLGLSAASFRKEEVLMAVGITAVITISLTIFAFQTKWDFTMMGGVLFVAVIVLMLFGIFAMIFPGKTMSLIYGCCGALLFSIYLIYDTQVMLGGNHKYAISPEEYIFAALNLYLDIINIFLYILTIISATRD